MVRGRLGLMIVMFLLVLELELEPELGTSGVPRISVNSRSREDS